MGVYQSSQTRDIVSHVGIFDTALNCCPTNLLPVQFSPSPLPCVNMYTVKCIQFTRTYTVRKGGSGMGLRASDRQTPAANSLYRSTSLDDFMTTFSIAFYKSYLPTNKLIRIDHNICIWTYLPAEEWPTRSRRSRQKIDPLGHHSFRSIMALLQGVPFSRRTCRLCSSLEGGNAPSP